MTATATKGLLRRTDGWQSLDGRFTYQRRPVDASMPDARRFGMFTWRVVDTRNRLEPRPYATLDAARKAVQLQLDREAGDLS